MNKRLDEIKRLRKKYHLTQYELAKRSGVSQSLIAKIEAGLLDPTYSRAEQIFLILDNIEEQKELKASDILNKKVAFSQGREMVKDIIKVMRQKGISQMPVINNEKRILGMITERIILEEISEKPDRLGQLRVDEIMENAPPIVPMNAGFRTISTLLKDNSVVLVMEKGEIKGIISKADLLGRME